jgi:hypothetical protein
MFHNISYANPRSPVAKPHAGRISAFSILRRVNVSARRRFSIPYPFPNHEVAP